MLGTLIHHNQELQLKITEEGLFSGFFLFINNKQILYKSEEDKIKYQTETLNFEINNNETDKIEIKHQVNSIFYVVEEALQKFFNQPLPRLRALRACSCRHLSLSRSSFCLRILVQFGDYRFNDTLHFTLFCSI